MPAFGDRLSGVNRPYTDRGHAPQPWLRAACRNLLLAHNDVATSADTEGCGPCSEFDCAAPCTATWPGCFERPFAGFPAVRRATGC
jgi:hypothetical protein